MAVKAILMLYVVGNDEASRFEERRGMVVGRVGLFDSIS